MINEPFPDWEREGGRKGGRKRGRENEGREGGMKRGRERGGRDGGDTVWNAVNKSHTQYLNFRVQMDGLNRVPLVNTCLTLHTHHTYHISYHTYITHHTRHTYMYITHHTSLISQTKHYNPLCSHYTFTRASLSMATLPSLMSRERGSGQTSLTIT